MRFAIVYYSKYGQTKKIVDYIKSMLVLESGLENIVHKVDVSQKENPCDIENRVDQVILGVPVYAGKFPRKMISWVKKNRHCLLDKKISVFLVSLNAADSREEAKRADGLLVQKLIRQLKLSPVHIGSFAGALNYTQYGFFTRYIMQRISRSAGGPTDVSRDYELTDWKKVKEFVELFRLGNLDRKSGSFAKLTLNSDVAAPRLNNTV